MASETALSKAASQLIFAGLCAFAFFVPISIAGANASLGALLLGLILRRAAGEPIPWESARGPLFIPLAAYAAAALLTSSMGVDPANSFKNVNRDIHMLATYCLLSIHFSRSESKAPLAMMALGAGFAACLGIYQRTFLLEPWGLPVRAHAFIHPVTYASQMAFAFLGAACWLLRSRGERKELQLAAGALAAAAGAALVMSSTRIAMIGAAAGFFSALWVLGGKARWLGAGLVAAAIAWAAVGPGHYPRSFVEEYRLWRSQPGAPTNGQLMRVTLWRTACLMARDYGWITGVGRNNYRQTFAKYTHIKDSIADPREDSWGNAHNLYFHQLAERGVVGLAALAFLLASIWLAAKRAATERGALGLWAFAVTNAFLIVNLTEVALEKEILWMMLFLILFLSGADRKARPAA